MGISIKTTGGGARVTIDGKPVIEKLDFKKVDIHIKPMGKKFEVITTGVEALLSVYSPLIKNNFISRKNNYGIHELWRLENGDYFKKIAEGYINALLEHEDCIYFLNQGKLYKYDIEKDVNTYLANINSDFENINVSGFINNEFYTRGYKYNIEKNELTEIIDSKLDSFFYNLGFKFSSFQKGEKIIRYTNKEIKAFDGKYITILYSLEDLGLYDAKVTYVSDKFIIAECEDRYSPYIPKYIVNDKKNELIQIEFPILAKGIFNTENGNAMFLTDVMIYNHNSILKNAIASIDLYRKEQK